MRDETGTGFKYGALIFSPPMGPDEPHSMGGGKETLAGNITSLIPAAELKHWREWLGSVAWRKIEHAGRIFVVRAAAAAPSVLDADNVSVHASHALTVMAAAREHGGDAEQRRRRRSGTPARDAAAA